MLSRRLMLMSKYDKFNIGDKVTVKADIIKQAYYSGYGMNPVFTPLTSDVVGMVGAIKVPKVYAPRDKRGWCPYFVCVDYTDNNGHKCRTAVEYSELVKVCEHGNQEK